MEQFLRCSLIFCAQAHSALLDSRSYPLIVPSSCYCRRMPLALPAADMQKLSSIQSRRLDWRSFATGFFEHTLKKSFVLLLVVFMCLYLPVLAGSSFVQSLLDAAALLFEWTASRANQQDAKITRRQQIINRKRHKKYFKHVVRCERHWRDVTNAVAEKQGFVIAFLCNPNMIRLVVALQYVICFWVPCTIGCCATCALLELWVHRVCASKHCAAQVSSSALGDWGPC